MRDKKCDRRVAGLALPASVHMNVGLRLLDLLEVADRYVG